MTMAIKWLWCRFQEEDENRRFFAKCMGAEIKESPIRPSPGAEVGGGVRSMFKMMSGASYGQTKFDVERIHVSKEEIAKRQQEE